MLHLNNHVANFKFIAMKKLSRNEMKSVIGGLYAEDPGTVFDETNDGGDSTVTCNTSCSLPTLVTPN
jgi:hypothetical protein